MMHPIRESLSQKINKRLGSYRAGQPVSISSQVLSKNPASSSISFCHRLSFGDGISDQEHLEYWARVLERYDDDFLLLLREMRRSRLADPADVFSGLFDELSIDFAARSRPLALIVSLFIQASGKFPAVTDVIDILSACSLQRYCVNDIIKSVAECSGVDAKRLRKAIRPCLATGANPLELIVLYFSRFREPIRKSDAMADLMSLKQFIECSFLLRDVEQIQSALVNVTYGQLMTSSSESI